MITWVVIIIVFGIAGLRFYLDNKKINEKKEFKPSPIVHFEHNGRYACNEAVKPIKEKLTEDWLGVTCRNCHNTKFYT